MKQLYTKQKRDDQITDPITGEVLFSTMDPIQLSEAKQRINLQRRELDKVEKWIDEQLAPFVDEALEAGADTFAEFWKIQRGAMRFDKKLFYTKAGVEDIQEYDSANDKIKSLTDKPEYYKASKPSLRYPKF